MLDAKETLLLKMMKGRGKGGILPVQINAGSEEHVAALSLLKEEPSMHFALDHGEALKMTIDLHLIGMLKEIPRMNMRSEITYKYTVSELEQQINDNAIKLLNKLRDNGVEG